MRRRRPTPAPPPPGADIPRGRSGRRPGGRLRRAHPLAGFALEATLPFLVHRVGAHLALAFEAEPEVAARRITLPMWRVLAALGRGGALGLVALAERTCVDLSTLSRQVAALVARGLVARRRSAADGRAVALALTARGRAVGAALVPVARRYERVALAGIGGRDAAALKAVLGRIYANVQALGAEPARPRRRRRRGGGPYLGAGDPG